MEHFEAAVMLAGIMTAAIMSSFRSDGILLDSNEGAVSLGDVRNSVEARARRSCLTWADYSSLSFSRICFGFCRLTSLQLTRAFTSRPPSQT